MAAILDFLKKNGLTVNFTVELASYLKSGVSKTIE